MVARFRPRNSRNLCYILATLALIPVLAGSGARAGETNWIRFRSFPSFSKMILPASTPAVRRRNVAVSVRNGGNNEGYECYGRGKYERMMNNNYVVINLTDAVEV